MASQSPATAAMRTGRRHEINAKPSLGTVRSSGWRSSGGRRAAELGWVAERSCWEITHRAAYLPVLSPLRFLESLILLWYHLGFGEYGTCLRRGLRGGGMRGEPQSRQYRRNCRRGTSGHKRLMVWCRVCWWHGAICNCGRLFLLPLLDQLLQIESIANDHSSGILSPSRPRAVLGRQLNPGAAFGSG